MSTKTASAAAFAMFLTLLSPAHGASMIYTVTGTLQALANGGTVNAPFTLTATADTSNVTHTGAVYTIPATAAYLTINNGVTNIPLANITIALDTSAGVVNIGNGSASGGLGLTSSALASWNLTSPIGPVTGPNFLVKGVVTTTDGGTFTLTGVSPITGIASPSFQASALMPFIASVSNAASITSPGLPNAGIAQGSIFILKGVGLGPAAITIASGTAAFQLTAFAGTSVSVTIGSTTVKALMYYTSDGQVAALLPSNTPTGNGTVTVSYNGQTSNPAPITVVANNIGLFTVDSSGTGPAIVTYPDYSLVTATKVNPCGGVYTSCGAANPKDVLILWTTGLGAVNGSDAAGVGLGVDMPSIPVKLWIGGVQATVSYRGRSGCCVGEDQIIFTVPDNAPTGCNVPLILQVGNQTSNSTILPVASGSRTCTPVNSALTNVQQLALTGNPITYGSITLRHTLNGILPPTFADDAKFLFEKVNGFNAGTQPFISSWLDTLTTGTCSVFPNLNGGLTAPFTGFTGLKAGNAFQVKGPTSTVSSAGDPSGSFDVNLSSDGTFLVPGAAYTVAGVGGPDVGLFAATTTFPVSPTLVSPANNATVTRANGMTVTWTGGGSGNVVIILTSSTDATYLNVNSAQAACVAPATAGTFTIPSYILQALPAATNAGIVLAPADTNVPFTATGLSVGYLTTHSDGTGYGYGAGTGSFALK